MSDVRLSAQVRTEFGKGGARRTRRAGNIPAVIYGHGAEPRHIALPDRDFANAVRHHGLNVLLSLDLDGEEQMCIPKAIQRHPIKGIFEHVDLLAVRRGEKVTIDVPLTVEGDVVPGGLVQQEHTSISVEAEATNLPTGFTVDITGREIGGQVAAGDIELPEGVSLVTDAEQMVVLISEAPTAEQLEAAEGEELGLELEAAAGEPAEAAAESAEPAEGEAE